MKRVICANNENIRDFNDINILALEDTMFFIQKMCGNRAKKEIEVRDVWTPGVDQTSECLRGTAKVVGTRLFDSSHLLLGRPQPGGYGLVVSAPCQRCPPRG